MLLVACNNVCYLESTLVVVPKGPAQTLHLKNSRALSLFRNHDLITQNNRQTLLWALSCRPFFVTSEGSLLLDSWMKGQQRYSSVEDNFISGCIKPWQVQVLLRDKVYFGKKKIFPTLFCTSIAVPHLFMRRQTFLQLISPNFSSSDFLFAVQRREM